MEWSCYGLFRVINGCMWLDIALCEDSQNDDIMWLNLGYDIDGRRWQLYLIGCISLYYRHGSLGIRYACYI